MHLLHYTKVILHSLIMFQSLFFSLYLLTQPSSRKRSNVWIAVFLQVLFFISAGGLLDHFLALRDTLLPSVPWLFYLNTPLPYLLSPLLLLYTLSLTREKHRLRLLHLLHLVPFLIAAIFVGLKVGTTPSDILSANVLQDAHFSTIEFSVLIFGAHLQFFSYLTVALFEVKSYREKIKELYSAVSKINLSWLLFVLLGFITWRSLKLVDYVFWLFGNVTASIALYIVAQVVFLVFVSLMVLKGLKQPVIFLGLDSPKAKRKYEKTLLREEDRESYRERLVRFMEDKKPFLNPMLSLPQLSSQVKIPVHQLSQVLNSSFQQNFFDFVNSYRIRESQRLLADSGSRNKTILDILYETGFNSKSVFNTAFKKQVGITPSQFKSQKSGRS